MRFALTIAAVFLASHAFAAPRMTSWDSEQNGSPKTYDIGHYAITLSAAKDADNNIVPRLTVSAPGLPKATLDGQVAGDAARADFTVLKLSPKERPSVVFSTYSGGAHCCFDVVVLQPAGKDWNKIDLGSWDGGVAYPKDTDGDGIVDFVFADNAFLYAFDSYAGSWPPPLVLNIVDGKAKNVSTAPRYAALYRADMKKTKPECAKHANGACAAFVADAARIGRTDEAWKFMLAHYDKTSTWTYPTRCDGAKIEGRCKDREIKPSGFPQALQWFLQDNGYTKR